MYVDYTMKKVGEWPYPRGQSLPVSLLAAPENGGDVTECLCHVLLESVLLFESYSFTAVCLSFPGLRNSLPIMGFFERSVQNFDMVAEGYRRGFVILSGHIIRPQLTNWVITEVRG